MAILNLQELNEEQLEKVGGGYIFNAKNGPYGFEIIDDDTGAVIARDYPIFAAQKYCEDHGLSPDWISWEDLLALRNKNA